MKFNGMLILVAVFLAATLALARAQSRETPLYDKDGRYSGSVDQIMLEEDQWDAVLSRMHRHVYKRTRDGRDICKAR